MQLQDSLDSSGIGKISKGGLIKNVNMVVGG
jgi:hypothetical protein